MKELMLLLASAMPKEKIIEQLEESINKWKDDSSEENWKTLEMTASLVTAKRLTGDKDLQKTSEAIDELNKVEKAMDIITPKDN